MKKGLVALLACLAMAPFGSASASDPITTPAPASQEGCVSQPGDTCTYTATRSGGLAAQGSTWSLVVNIPAAGDPRDVNLDGQLTYTFGPSNAPEMGCGLWDAGATVTTTAGSNGGLAAGNPFPAPADAVTGSANDCEGGKLPNRTDVTPQ